jgi:hypothetical protein
MAKKFRQRGTDPVVTQLEDIKRLLVLQLVVAGVQAQLVGKVLGVSKQTISGMVPARLIKRGAT